MAALVAALVAGGIVAIAVSRDDATSSDRRSEQARERGTTTTIPDLLGEGNVPVARLTATETAALDALGVLPAPTTPFEVADAHSHDDHVAPTVVLPPAVEAERNEQLDVARQAAERWPTAKAAMADGFAVSSGYSPGIGAHLTRWSWIDQPFDPARPAMLLYDGLDEDSRLVGLSYWTRSDPGPPAGFAGPDDVWHRHFGMCIRKGIAAGENLPTSTECPDGVYLDGRNLWMLHAWVIEGWSNPRGTFAPTNPEVGDPPS